MAQMVKNMIAMQGTWVQPLGWKDPPQKKIATRCSILVWEIPWTGTWWSTIHGVAKNLT